MEWHSWNTREFPTTPTIDITHSASRFKNWNGITVAVVQALASRVFGTTITTNIIWWYMGIIILYLTRECYYQIISLKHWYKIQLQKNVKVVQLLQLAIPRKQNILIQRLKFINITFGSNVLLIKVQQKRETYMNWKIIVLYSRHSKLYKIQICRRGTVELMS